MQLCAVPGIRTGLENAKKCRTRQPKAIFASYAQSTSKQGPSQICLVGSLAYHAQPYARATMTYYIEQLFPHTGHIRPQLSTRRRSRLGTPARHYLGYSRPQKTACSLHAVEHKKRVLLGAPKDINKSYMLLCNLCHCRFPKYAYAAAYAKMCE